MPNQSNLGTIVVGTDSGHSSPRSFSAPIMKTSTDVFAGSTGAGRLGDLVVNSDGHTGTIVSGSSTVMINGLPAARLGDKVIGTLTGTIVGGVSSIQTG